MLRHFRARRRRRCRQSLVSFGAARASGPPIDRLCASRPAWGALPLNCFTPVPPSRPAGQALSDQLFASGINEPQRPKAKPASGRLRRLDFCAPAPGREALARDPLISLRQSDNHRYHHLLSRSPDAPIGSMGAPNPGSRLPASGGKVRRPSPPGSRLLKRASAGARPLVAITFTLSD